MIYETQIIYENGTGQAIGNNANFTFDTPIILDNIVDMSMAVEYVPSGAPAVAGGLFAFGKYSLTSETEGAAYSSTSTPLTIFPVSTAPYVVSQTERSVNAIPPVPGRLCKVELSNNTTNVTLTIKSIKVMVRKAVE